VRRKRVAERTEDGGFAGICANCAHLRMRNAADWAADAADLRRFGKTSETPTPPFQPFSPSSASCVGPSGLQHPPEPFNCGAAPSAPMSHDPPNAEFDHAVLDKMTSARLARCRHPAYSGCLKRLYAAQAGLRARRSQGRACHRALAGPAPAFSRAQPGAFIAGRITGEALEPTTEASTTATVQSLPAAHRARAESHRLMVLANRAHHRPSTTGPSCTIPCTCCSSCQAPARTGAAGKLSSRISVSCGTRRGDRLMGGAGAHCDDGACLFSAPTLPEAWPSCRKCWPARRFT